MFLQWSRFNEQHGIIICVYVTMRYNSQCLSKEPDRLFTFKNKSDIESRSCPHFSPVGQIQNKIFVCQHSHYFEISFDLLTFASFFFMAQLSKLFSVFSMMMDISQVCDCFLLEKGSNIPNITARFGCTNLLQTSKELETFT